MFRRQSLSFVPRGRSATAIAAVVGTLVFAPISFSGGAPSAAAASACGMSLGSPRFTFAYGSIPNMNIEAIPAVAGKGAMQRFQ